jgi:8-oxo-dGTP pyrophosphatase MutT (NUDIX family)
MGSNPFWRETSIAWNNAVYNEAMQIDPRLNEIDDCLYRVAVRVLIVQNDEVLLVRESSDDWWALPGGGIDHGESVESTLIREVEEELGVPVKEVSSDFQIVHFNIGNVVNTVPRMNLFFKASVPEDSLKKTDHVAEWHWFTKEEFLKADLHSSYDKTELAAVVFAS